MQNLLVSAFDFTVVFSNIASRWYYYAAAAAGVAAVVLFLIFRKTPRKRPMTDTQKITYIAILTALCTVTNIFSIQIVPNRLTVSFVALPCFFAGYLLGAKSGFAVGFIGDLLGCIIAPQGAYLPLIGLASGLWGFIPGVIFDYFKGNDLTKIIISFSVCFAVCSCFLTTLANWLYVVLDRNSATTFWVYLSIRAWFQAIVALGNAGVCYALMKFAPRLLPKLTKPAVSADKERGGTFEGCEKETAASGGGQLETAVRCESKTTDEVQKPKQQNS